ARAVNPHFRITPENLAAVAGICRRLDGLPLAIELASARAAVLAPEDLLERLERRLPVLTGGTRDLPERHQTLRQAIAWSYDLLNDPEQRLFRRLAVFGGGFSLAAAEAIGGADLAGGVLDLLTSLLDKHLVQAAAEPDGMRFSLLETVREFGLECLAASGELAGVAARHGEHFVQLAEAGYGRQVGSAQASWFRRLERELGNLRAAARWIVEQQDAGRAARLGLSLWRFWDRGYIVEGRAWLESFLGLPGLAAPGPARCRLLFAAGRLAYRQADYSPAAALLTECLAIARAERDDDFTASALTQLAHLAYAQGDLEIAERRYAESLDIRRRAGDDARTIAVSLYGLARVHRARADYAVARALLVESLEQFQAAEDDVQIAGVLVALGLVALLEGDDEEAGGAFRESLARALKVGDRPGEAGALIGLAYAALGRGQPRRARTLLGESLALARATDGRQLVVQCLEGMAAVLAADGEGRRAWRLAAAVAAYRARAAVPQDPSERVLLARYLDPVAATLQPGERAALWATGSALTPEEALAGIEWPGVVVPLESIRANLVQYEREREVRA
ncbi:MAG TPA: tetratricopeptide repeat protein, partial [Nitrolancea sp.]|nr:tetratricopeptide repeat protein [Nitrolancea sp.]